MTKPMIFLLNAQFLESLGTLAASSLTPPLIASSKAHYDSLLKPHWPVARGGRTVPARPARLTFCATPSGREHTTVPSARNAPVSTP